MDISNKTVTELKALAYDYIGQLEFIRNNLATINNEIQKKMAEEKKVQAVKDQAATEEAK